MTISKELIAASTEPLILSILSKGENYGYAIIQSVKRASGGAVTWKDGMLYPVLHRMEERGYIQYRWSMSKEGRRRRYYRINQKGRKRLQEHRHQWTTIHQAFQVLWGTSHV